jgi:hypothetical protein
MEHLHYILMKHQFWSIKDQFNGNTEMKHQFRSIKDQFNGNTERKLPPTQLIGHEVYKIVKDIHVVLDKP